MHLNEKRLAVAYGEKVTLHYNGWDVSGTVVGLKGDKVNINNKYYDLRSCLSVTSDYDRSLALATEKARREGYTLEG